MLHAHCLESFLPPDQEGTNGTAPEKKRRGRPKDPRGKLKLQKDLKLYRVKTTYAIPADMNTHRYIYIYIYTSHIHIFVEKLCIQRCICHPVVRLACQIRPALLHSTSDVVIVTASRRISMHQRGHRRPKPRFGCPVRCGKRFSEQMFRP